MKECLKTIVSVRFASKRLHRCVGLACWAGCIALPLPAMGQLSRYPMAISEVEKKSEGDRSISPVPVQPSRPSTSPRVPPGFWGPAAPVSPIEQAMESPVFKRILSLMEENMELKAEMRIQAIQAEAKEQVQTLKLETKTLREQLERTEEALRQANRARESLEKRISELDHRSRLLEERARSMADSASEVMSVDRLTKFLGELQNAFDHNLHRIQQRSKDGRGRKSDEDSQEQKAEAKRKVKED